MKVELSEKTVEFVRGLVAAIDAQNNRCTANPYFFVIQEKERVVTPEGCGDYVVYHDHDGVVTYTADELIENLGHPDVTDGWDDDWDDERAVEEIVSASGGRITEHEVREEWITPEKHNVFFTESAIKIHIAQNDYHFGETRTYVRHAWRNPEIEGIFAALREIAEQSS